MDWLMFKFCFLIWILLCVSKSRSQELNSTSSISRSNQAQSACEEGQPVLPPDKCNYCICFAGLVYCTNITCSEQECVAGEEIPPPDACNKCICRRGKVSCTNLICIPAQNCAEEQLYPSQNECNACVCLNGFITCTSNVCAEGNLTGIKTVTTTTTKTTLKTKKCIEGSHLPGPNKCTECVCENGRKRCTNSCSPTGELENRFSGNSRSECTPGQVIPKPDDCNNCLCFEGEIHCTHKPCHTGMRIGQECNDDQPVIRIDECNECHCFESKLHCSNVVCIRGSKCVQGQVIPKPDLCNACKCIEGHILCTNYPCPIINTRNALAQEMSPTFDIRPAECQDGDVIPPLPPPYDCNICFCVNNSVLCTMRSCADSDIEIQGRIKEQNEQNHLQMFDKQISVEPFIDNLYKNNEKMPTKVIHTHAYNGFHQEIKVHANHLPKDATSLIKALATTLDNSALASIGQKLLMPSDSLSNNPEVVQNNLGEGIVITTQSSKLITSGSQSNETILVVPDTDFFDSENSQSVLPLSNKHETIWKTISAPATTVYHNNQLILPHNSQEENLNIYHDDKPSIFPFIQQSDMIRNPSKFGRPGLPRTFPTTPMTDTLELSNVNTQSNPKLNEKPNSINYAPFYHENNQFRPVPSGFVEQPTMLGHTPIFNYSSPTPVFGPGNLMTPNVNGDQQNPSQSQFVPNPTKYYLQPQGFQFKPNQNQPNIISNSNEKGIQYPLLFPNAPNQPIVTDNRYKPPQFGLKPGQGNPLNNIGTHTDQKFKQFPPNFQIPPVINLPDQKKRISSLEIEANKEKPINSKFGPNSVPNGVNPEHTQHKPIPSQFVPNPSIYYKHEYQAPKINEVNPEEEQILQYPKLPFTSTKHNNQSHTNSEPDQEKIIPKVRNKTKKYNTTHSHYAKHTSITYISEYDPNDPAHPKIVEHEPNQDDEQPDSLSGPTQNKDLPGMFDDRWSSDGFQFPSNSAESPLQTKDNQHHPLQSLFLPTHNQYKDTVHKQPDSLSGPTQNKDLPGMFDDRWSSDGFQFPSHSAESPLQTKDNQHHPLQPQFLPTHNQYKDIIHKQPDSLSGPTQNKNLPGMLDDRWSSDGFQFPSHSAESPLQTKDNQHHPLQSQFLPTHNPYKDTIHKQPDSLSGPTQNKDLPGMFDDRWSSDGFQFPSHSAESPLQTKDNQYHPPQSQFLPTHDHGFQYPTYSAEDPTHSKTKLNKFPHFEPAPPHYDSAHPKDNLHISPYSQLAPAQNKQNLGMFDNHEVNDKYQYAHNANQNPAHLKPLYELPNLLFDPILNQQKPETLGDKGLSDGFQYPSNSTDNPIHSRGNLNIPQKPRLSANQIQYPSKSAEHPLYPKGKTQMPINSPFEPIQNQKLPGIIDDRGSAGGFQYPSNSAEKSMNPKDSVYNPLYSKENLYRPLLPPFGSTQNQHPRDSHYPTQLPKTPSHPIKYNQQQPYPLYGPTQNQHLPGMFDERGSPDGFQYPSHSAKNPSHPIKNIQQKPNSPYDPTQNKDLPGMFDDRWSSDGFQFPSHSAESPLQTKDNQHHPLQSQFLPTHNQYKDTIHKQPDSLSGPTQNKDLPGMFDDRWSSDGFQFPSHSAEVPLHPIKNIQQKPNSLYGPTQNQHLPGMFDNRGSPDRFPYPSYSAENPSHQKQPNSPYSPIQNQHSPGIFDARGSASGFKYPSYLPENPSHQKQPVSFYGPAQNQNSPTLLDERGSTDGVQYPPHSAENTTHPKDKLTQSSFGPTQNKDLPGIFDDRWSSDGFQFPSQSAESPLQTKDNQHHPLQSQFLPTHDRYKDNIHNQPDSLSGPTQNKDVPGIFDDRWSSDGFQFPSHSAESPLQTKDSQHYPLQSEFLPTHDQYKDALYKQLDSIFGPPQNKDLPETLDDRWSSDGLQYPSHSIESPLQTNNNPTDPLSHFPVTPTQNQHSPSFSENPSRPNQKQPNSPYGTQNQNLLVPFDKLQPSTAEEPIHPNGSIQNVLHPQLNPTLPQKDSIHKQPKFSFGPTQINDLPEVFEEVGATDEFQHPFQSADDPTYPKNNLDTTPDSKLTSEIYNDQANQPNQKPDLHAITPTSNNYNSNNPLRPYIHLDHDQYKPSSFDNLLNGVHNIPWLLPDDQKKVSNVVTSTFQPRSESDRDQYKPSSFDNILNGVHDIPWYLLENNEKFLNTITSAPKGRFKPEHDQYKSSSLDNSLNGIHEIPWPISNQDSDVLENDNELQTGQDMSAPSIEPTNSDGTQFNSHDSPVIKPDSDPDKVVPIDDDKISDYYDQLYPLLIAVKKLSEPPFDESELTVDRLGLLFYLFPSIAKTLIYDPEDDSDNDNTLPVENPDSQKISPWNKIMSKLKQLPVTSKEMINWAKSKLNNLVPIKHNGTAIRNDIDMTKIFQLLTKIRAPKINVNTVPQNISFSSFDQEIIDNITKIFQEDTPTTTPPSRTDATNSYNNRFKTVPTDLEENPLQAPQIKYPDVHIILHQTNDQDDLDSPPYIETDGAANVATDLDSEELGPVFPKTFNSRFRHKPKDQKDECGDGTYWIRNCHGCSCYFGQPMCFKILDCELRPFGEPMTCKPYSHYKMGCYTCECNGDGVAECDAKDCSPKSSRENIEMTATPPEFNEFFDSKETVDILQYYNINRKLPKNCPKQNLQAQYPTCERGTSWISNCHKCECNESGKHKCIKIDDCELDFESYGKPTRCKPNTKFYPKTNSVPCVECSCNDEGKPYCPVVDYKKH